jgi:hypothetical protein
MPAIASIAGGVPVERAATIIRFVKLRSDLARNVRRVIMGNLTCECDHTVN